METKTKKDFDAVAWSRTAKRHIASLLEDATPEEIIAYFNDGKRPEREEPLQKGRKAKKR